MTAELTVPADVWACKQPGVPLVAAIVEGEPVHTPTCSWGTARPSTDDCHCKGRIVPPLWLVALRDARCETCGGSSRVKGMNHGPGDLLFPCPNDRCVDGRLLHDVQVECSGCWYRHVGRAEPNHTTYCDSYRTVRCLVDVVKVTHVHDPITDDDPEISVDDRAGSVWTIGVAGRKDGELTPAHVDALAAACGKPPADWVGGYAVILTEVGE